MRRVDLGENEPTSTFDKNRADWSLVEPRQGTLSGMQIIPTL